jgi:hypothetical protein
MNGEARVEYGDNLSPWTQVPGVDNDPVASALRLAGSKGLMSTPLDTEQPR